MFKTIKTAMGAAIGLTLGFALMGFMKNEVMKWGAKDEEFMEYEKQHHPEMYEKLKKYQ